MGYEIIDKVFKRFYGFIMKFKLWALNMKNETILLIHLNNNFSDCSLTL